MSTLTVPPADAQIVADTDALLERAERLADDLDRFVRGLPNELHQAALARHDGALDALARDLQTLRQSVLRHVNPAPAA